MIMKNTYSNLMSESKFNLLIIVFALLLGNTFWIHAQEKIPFTQRTSMYSPGKTIYNLKGDFTMLGNTNLTLQDYGDETSNSNTMRYVDIDGDASTWNSSSADLVLSTENGADPNCSKIVYAGLYWTGRASNSSSSPNTFTVSKTVETGNSIPFTDSFTVTNGNSIPNSGYSMSVTRQGNSDYTVRYTFTGNGATFEFEFLNSSSYIRYRQNSGSWVIPGNQNSSTSGNTRTVTFNDVTIYSAPDGSKIVINSLTRDTRTNRSESQYRNNADAKGNVTYLGAETATINKDFNKRIVQLKGPGATSYSQIVAQPTDIYYPVNGDGFMYSAYAEITDYVRNNGTGKYTVADIALIEGAGGSTGYYGGWGMIVIYENSKMKWRDVTVFDGHYYVAGSTTANYEIPISGFNTAQSGPVNMKLGLMAGEGDRGISGDYFEIRNHQDSQWIRLNHSSNTTGNFFNSSINTNGTPRNPNLLNNTGLDISMFDIANANNSVIKNNQTATKFRYGSTQDTYIIFNIAMSVDAYIPEVESLLTINSVNGVPTNNTTANSIEPGQEMSYTVDIKNLGTEAVNNYKLVIPIPFTATFVPGSLSSSINFTPIPTPNNLYFDANLGATGSIVWDLGSLPLPANPEILLASLTFKLKATEDCTILVNATCSNSIQVNGYTSGKGAVTQIPFNNLGLILGHDGIGNCGGQNIPQPLNISIVGGQYISDNCLNIPPIRSFTFCNGESQILPSQIASAFPFGVRYYATYPITIDTPVLTSFPATPGTTTTYYAVAANSNGCYFEFTITICNAIVANDDIYNSISCGTTGVIGNILTNDRLNGSAVSTSNVDLEILSGSYNGITIAANGDISLANNLTAGTYVFTYKICKKNDNTKCDDATIKITITDTTAPVIATLPAPSTVECGTVPNFAQATATDNCATTVNLTYVDTTTPGNCEGNYTIIRTWTANDGNGNTSTATQTITVQDTTAPVIAALPAPSTISCGQTPVFVQATATDNCGNATLTFEDVTTQGNCEGAYSITRRWTATDACGNTANASQTINVQDTTAPVIAALPAATTIECGQTPVFAQATATDNCGNATLTFEDVTTQGNCEGAYSITRNWTATDACGNTANASQTINVQDTTAPVIAALPAVTTIECGQTPVFVQATATDNCGNATLTFEDVTTQGNCEGAYSITRRWTATDACGNTANASQTINVQDTTAPVIAALPAATTIECGQTPVFAQATATDNCGNATLTFEDVTTQGNCEGAYSITRNWTATDACGNIANASQTINVQDTTAPVIATLPAATTIECGQTPVFAQATATDNCGNATLTFEDVTTQGNCEGAYSITRNWTATDACGNTANASQTINVQDTTAPVFTNELPSDVTVECNNVPEIPTITATDNCQEIEVLYKEVIAPKECENNYRIYRVWTATDLCGNTTTHKQTINVQDTTAPVIAALPAATTIECGTEVVFAQAKATDNCGNATLTFEDVTTQGNCEGAYSITRRWTATDACGNTANASQTINVQDTTAPTITTQAANLVVECDGSGNQNAIQAWLNNNGNAQANDTCSQVTWTNNFNNLEADCSAAVTVIFTATDACGNTATTTATFSVQDTTAPVIAALPAATTIECGTEVVFAQATAIDNCGNATLTFEDVTTQGDCEGAYSITRNWTATDACGNTANASQTINVQDTTAPVIAALPAATTIECGTEVVFVQATVTDNCGNATLTFEDVTTQGECEGAYSITRNWTATDACGNTANASQTINVQDTTAPVIAALPAATTIECSTEVVFAQATVTDNCGNATLTFEDVTTQGECEGAYSITRTWKATDACGNFSTATQTIDVEDNVGPVVTTDFETTISISCDAVPSAPELSFADSCSTVEDVIFTEERSNESETAYTITRTWLVADSCGNASTFVQTINVSIANANTSIDRESCNEDITTYLLSDLLPEGTPEGGVWMDVNNSGGIQGDIFNPSLVRTLGDYILRYEITEGSCPRTVDVVMNVNDLCRVLPCQDIIVYNAVTPDGDGKNDFFNIQGIENTECYPTNHVEIYNRWGVLVYEIDNYDNNTRKFEGYSEGRVTISKGSGLPSGTYFYILKYATSEGNSVTKNGYLYLSK